jgi:signal transduction histidine kinase
MPPEVEATIYFLVAEALTNARKHAQAHAVSVRATLRGGILHVEVGDDGIGGARATPGSGLEGLRDRVEAVGGTLRIDSPLRGGTLLTASIPAATLA